VALTVLFVLPTLLAAIPRFMFEIRGRPMDREELFQVELMFVFFLVPHAVIPLACLLFGAGIINDEIEDQTLTYLLLRPIYRSAIYVVKLICAILLVWTLVAFFIPPLLWVIWWQQPKAPVTAWDLCQRSGEVVFALCLAATAYNAVFGLLSLLTRRILVFGIFYIVVLEGVLANLPLVVREFTLMYYLRVLILRGPGSPPADKIWGIDLSMAPEAASAGATLLVTAALATGFAAYLFSIREFRLKTPDGA
jgi:ABC-2 type transport system permease protein